MLLPFQIMMEPSLDHIPSGGAVMGGSASIIFLDRFNFARPLLPSIEFEVDLTMPTSELIGPKLNLRKVPVYHSEGNSADTTRQMVKDRESQFSAILQRFTPAGGKAVKHGDRFIEVGEKAIYLRDMYTTANPTGFPASQMALLKIVGSDTHDHDVYKRGILTPGVKIQ